MKVVDAIGRRLLLRKDWLGRIAGKIVDRFEAVRGPVYAQRIHRQALNRGRSIRHGLQEVSMRWPDVGSSSSEKPVFVLSAGWRSGSTLLQRLVMSRRSVIIWGEPYSHARIIAHLADGVSAITPDWPQDEWLVGQYDLAKLHTTFPANLYPEPQDMLEACLAYTQALFASPARQRGFQRWGLKDVRLTIDDAHFLRWLYPHAKFVFLCRNPYDAYRSYRLTREWYNEWPDDPVFTADRFGRHWRLLVEGFQNGVNDIGGLFIQYEDLCSGAVDIASLQQYLDVEIDADLLGKPVGSHRLEGDSVPRQEMRMLSRAVADKALELGYQR